MSNDDRNDNAAPDKNDVDEQLKQQLSSIWKLRRECRLRPAWRVAQEARRLAKAESRLIPYLTANFNIINLARDVYEPGAGKDAAIETIALLESADRARNFQGDYDQREYDYTVGWMSACAYDNLATATGEISGYNSPGMQACIADGMDVCRRTGKLRCLACFREYATEVFRAADDLDMALHHARTNAIAKIDERGDDRRWVGASDEAGLLLLAGQLQPAWEAALRADILATKYHSPARALRKQAALKRTIATVWGRDDLLTSIQCDAPELPVDEDPEHDLRLALLDAITAACRGDFAGAVKVLTRWDKLLSDRQYVHKWFDVRLHLIAAYRMAGQNDRAAALAKPLKTKATAAQDYLTLHRLARLEDPALPVTPTAAVGPMSVGPFAQAGDAVTMTVAATPRPPPASTPARADEAGPLRAMTDDLAAQLRAEAEGAARESRPPSFAAVAARVLEVPPGQVTHPDDAARLIHLLSVTATGGPAAGAAESLESRAWTWASDIAAAHPAAPSVASLLAHLGLVLREQEGSMLAGAIDPANLQALHRRAMDTAPDRPGVFMRAAMFHLSSSGDGAEAERCLARAFRLDRTNEWIARRLADIYARTGRGGDGLHVLDLCAREGGAAASAELLWQAAVRASGLGKHEATLTYLDVFERRVGESTPLWTNYHRATSLLALNRPAEALPAIEREATAYAAASEGRAESGLHIHAVRAAAAAALQQPDAVRQHVLAAAGVNLTSIQDLSRAGILASHAYLWDAATSTLPDSDDPARRHLTQRLLASGVIPGAFWRHHRLGNRGAGAATDKVKGLHHYLVNIRQPFDARFTESGACPPDLREARAYQVQYGVLATDEADAEQRALAWQSRAADLAPEVISIQPDGGPYFDHPGITDRSVPEPVDDALSA